jgi:hypothetical protein
MPWLLWGRRKWVVRRAGPNESLLAPRDSIIIINTMSNNVSIVYQPPAGGDVKEGEVVDEPPTVDGEPEPGMCVLGHYIPCGEPGIKQLQDWFSRFPIIIIYNIGLPIYDPAGDMLPPEYYCHHGYTALVIPIKRGGGKKTRVDRLPWKKACQVSVLTLHEVLGNSGFGVRLE